MLVKFFHAEAVMGSDSGVLGIISGHDGWSHLYNLKL